MSISATQVRELREKTNAGMMDCKKALEETKGDFEAAIDWLRTKGLASAAKKSDRVATEGLVQALRATDGKSGVLVEVNSETDFVSRNDGFKAFVNDMATQALTAPANVTEAAQMLDMPYSKNPSVKTSEFVKETIAKIGENLVVRRFTKYTSTDGYVHTYVHGEGKIGVLLEMTTSAINDTVKTVANDVCLHIAAMNPISLSQADMPPEIVAKEKEVLKAKNLEQGKKPEMVDKIVEGQIRKFLSESCLLEQAFVKNPDMKISDYVKSTAPTATIKRFTRFELGEGLQKKVNDFAAEVAAQAAQGH